MGYYNKRENMTIIKKKQRFSLHLFPFDYFFKFTLTIPEIAPTTTPNITSTMRELVNDCCPPIKANIKQINRVESPPISTPLIKPILSFIEKVQPKNTANTFKNWLTAFMTLPPNDANFIIAEKIKRLKKAVISADKTPFIIVIKKLLFVSDRIKNPLHGLI